MERNHNEQQIVMSIEHYRNLLGMADRSQYTTKKIERHVRKHNPFLQPEHQATVQAFEQVRSKNIREARGLVENYHGKLVYAVTRVNQHRDDAALQGEVYTQVRVACVNREKRYLVDVYRPENIKQQRSLRQCITANQVIYDMPEGYILLLGPGVYRGLVVKEWSPIHWYHLQEQAEREDWEREQYLEKQRKAAFRESNPTPKLESAVAYDVIGER